MPFLPPQYYVLSVLAEFASVEDLLAAKVSEEFPILPHPVAFSDNALTLAYPGDEEHS